MSNSAPRWPSALCLVGSALGLYFGATSTIDYVKHLDRQVHDIHCSFVPGAGVEQAAENPCRAALYSPYSALLRDQIWGGIPISLFAVGAFAFFVAFSLYLLLAADKAPRRAVRFMGVASLTPLAVSVLMAVISAVKLGAFCKTCMGIYIGSAVLAVGGVAGWILEHREPKGMPRTPAAGSNVPPTVVDEHGADARGARPLGSTTLMAMWLLGLGLFTMIPAGVYYQSVPSYAKHVGGCGKLVSSDDPKKAFLHFTSAAARQPVIMVIDPLCPTCKAFHQRLVADGIFEKLDTTMVLFPLDSECNWNLTAPLHPGACTVARAVLCDEQRAMQVLEWAYEEQDELVSVAKSKDGNEQVLARIKARWPGLEACVKDDKSRLRLDEHLRFAVKNQLPVSTPQLFIGDTRLCDEDLDIGLPYALGKLAPALAQR